MADILLPIVRQAFPMPLTAVAIRDAAIYVQASWVEAAQSGRFLGTATGGYVQGLQMAESLTYPLGGDVLAALVANVARYARAIEDGHPASHLPSVINWSTARGVKRSKKGVPYLRIPFRHSVPRAGAGITSQARRTMMPTHVYAVAQQLTVGQRTTAGETRGNAVHVPGLTGYRPAYAPNIRTVKPRGAAARTIYQHASIHEGMQKRGATGHSQYMTFRTMTQRSTGWWIPPRPATHIAATVARDVMPDVVKMVTEAFTQDLQNQLAQHLT